MYTYEDLLRRTIESHEKSCQRLLKYQIRDKASPDFGGYYNVHFGLVAQNAGGSAAGPMSLYFCEESRYYKDPAVLELASNLIRHLLNHLHEDGTVDYFRCNFHSAPDTAFVTLGLAKAAKLIKAETPEEKAFQEELYEALRRMGEGMLTGGFHTPNHRWVISSALALINSLIPDKRYEERIKEYLIEGIDINEDGEFTERSAGGYNEINNRALITLAQELKKPQFYDYVRRNLEMMPVFYHTDFSIFTENSTRQDKGSTPYAEKYAYQYLLCGYALDDENLRRIGTALLKSGIDHGRAFPLGLTDLLLYPEAFSDLPEPCGDEIFRVNRLLKDSGLLRLSRKGLNLWAVENQPAFLHLKKGNIEFYIKGGIHFFNARHLLFENIRKEGEGYAMDFVGKGHYYQPFKRYQGTSDWHKMDRSKREISGEREVKVTLRILPLEDGYEIRLKTSGSEGSTIRLEFGIKANVLLRGEHFSVDTKPGGMLIASGGELSLFDGDDMIGIGPAFAANDIYTGLFGSIPPSEQRFNLYFNDVTNFERSFQIRVK